MSALPSPLAVYALSAPALEAARRLREGLPGAVLFLPRRLAGPGEEVFERFSAALEHNFTRFRGHLVFGAAGLVVRTLAGLMRHKAQDPAVVVLDPKGRFAVSLLSGHLGGANRLAREAARILGGRAVITTATDALGLPSLEVVADEADCRVENLEALAGLSARLLEGGRVPVWDPGGWLRPALAAWAERFSWLERPPHPQREPGPLAWVDWRLGPSAPRWLVIRPPALAVGVGCNRGTPEEEIAAVVEEVLAAHGLARPAVACLASLSLKRHEPGLLALARRWEVPILFHEPHQLQAVAVPTPSQLVARHVGTESVCEAAALLAAGSGELMVNKHKRGNVTVAVALRRPGASSTW